LATLSGSPQQVDISVGAVLGAGLLAFTLIPAVCVVFAPDFTLELTSGVLIRDVLFFCAALLLLSILARDSQLTASQSGMLMSVYAPYLCILLAWTSPPHRNLKRTPGDQYAGVDYGTVSRPEAFSDGTSSASDDSDDDEWVPGWFKALLPPYGMDPEKHFGKVFFLSLIFISGLSEACLQVSSLLAKGLGLTHHWTGFVLVGLGAQVEDLFASVSLAKKGKASSAIAAIVGSQVLNISIGVGLPFCLSSVMNGNPMIVHESSLSAFVVFCVVVLFSFLCFKRALLCCKQSPSQAAALGIWDVPLLIAAYVGAVAVVF
jgi:Ca2+/Na+ antiporter